MPQELTTEYNMENWREATKGWTFMPYSIEGYGELPGTICVDDAPVSGKPYKRADFERDLSKVSKRRNLPVGEHIREAIHTIKGNKD